MSTSKISKSGIIRFHLNKNRMYKHQEMENGENLCMQCNSHNKNNTQRKFTLQEMEADHIMYWMKGDSEEHHNCMLLCTTHQPKRKFKFQEIEADHIIPWNNGNNEERHNCMLCKYHNYKSVQTEDNQKIIDKLIIQPNYQRKCVCHSPENTQSEVICNGNKINIYPVFQRNCVYHSPEKSTNQEIQNDIYVRISLKDFLELADFE